MIIGLAGSFGAGKGAVVDYLVKEHGFTHYSMSGFITEEVERRGMPVNRDSMIEVANDLRSTHGPTYIVDTLFARAQKHGGNAVIESLRAVAEVRRIKELGGTVIGVDAKPRIRYERSLSRGSKKDDVSFEKWLDQEKRETNPGDPTKQDIPGSLKKADRTVMNDGTLDELRTRIKSVLKDIADTPSPQRPPQEAA